MGTHGSEGTPGMFGWMDEREVVDAATADAIALKLDSTVASSTYLTPVQSGAVFVVSETAPTDTTRLGVPVVWIYTPPPTYAQEVAADAPTTYLAFDGNTTNAGSVAEVYTPTALTYGATLGDGAQAGVFDGTSTCLAAPQGAGTGLNACTAFTVEALVKATAFTATQKLAMQLNTWDLYIGTNGYLYASINGGTPANNAAPLTAGVRYHIAVVYDGAALTFYVNGLASGAGANTGALNDYGTAPPRVGYNGSSEFANGSLAGLAMYRNNALSAARILAHAVAAGAA